MVLSVVTLGSVSHLLMKCNARPTSKSASSRAPTTNRAISQLWREAGGVKAEMGCCSQDPAQHGVPRGGRLQPPSHSSSTCLQTPCGTLALAGFKQPALGLLEWGYPRPTGRCRHPDFQGHQDGKVTALSPLTVKQPAIVTPLPITHQCQKTALCKQQHQCASPALLVLIPVPSSAPTHNCSAMTLACFFGPYTRGWFPTLFHPQRSGGDWPGGPCASSPRAAAALAVEHASDLRSSPRSLHTSGSALQRSTGMP